MAELTMNIPEKAFLKQVERTPLLKVYKETPEKLTDAQRAIFDQRFANIEGLMQEIRRTYPFTEEEYVFLEEYFKYDNRLNDVHFIGCDFFSDMKFMRRRVPYLYRSVGGSRSIYKNQSEPMDIRKIFQQCLNQITSGNNGFMLYSYSKCLGENLLKYANLERRSSVSYERQELTYEVRENAWINAISHKDDLSRVIMLQQYNDDMVDPYFAIDMGSARENASTYVKSWCRRNLGYEEKYLREIYDPVEDTEVVLNYVNFRKENEAFAPILAKDVLRLTFDMDALCCLIYNYFRIFVQKPKEAGVNITLQQFEEIIDENIRRNSTKEGFNAERYFKWHELFLNGGSCGYVDVERMLKRIDWEFELKCMAKKEQEFFKPQTTQPDLCWWKQVVWNAAYGYPFIIE